MIRNPAQRSARSAHRGFTLIEALVVVTGVSTVIGVCALTIGVLLRVSAAGQERLSSAIADDRISRQLRDDVHNSERAQLLPREEARGEPPGLRLTLPADHLITYTVREGSIVREESRAGKKVRHESYVLRRNRVARFEQRDLGARDSWRSS